MTVLKITKKENSNDYSYNVNQMELWKLVSFSISLHFKGPLNVLCACQCIHSTICLWIHRRKYSHIVNHRETEDECSEKALVEEMCTNNLVKHSNWLETLSACKTWWSESPNNLQWRSAGLELHHLYCRRTLNWNTAQLRTHVILVFYNQCFVNMKNSHLKPKTRLPGLSCCVIQTNCLRSAS